MADEATSHPGSWVGDSIEEFKKAPTPVKIGVVIAVIAAAGIGYYEYSKNKSSGTQSGTTASPSVDTSGASASQFPTVPGGNTGTVPVLPGGLQPLFDASGQLIGFEPIPTTGTTTTGTGSTSTGGTKKKKKEKKGSTSSSSSGSKGHTTKQHQQNGSQHKPSVSGNQGHTTKSSKTIQPKNTGGSHGYVYTVKPGDTLAGLQKQFFPGSNGSNKQGNIMQYGNNSQILKQKGVVNTKTGALKPGTKILA